MALACHIIRSHLLSVGYKDRCYLILVKAGCGCGCLTVAIAGLLVGGLLWLASGVLGRPVVQYETGTPADGRRAQQKLFELAAAGTAASRRGERRIAVTFSERELNALLERHLADEELPLAEMRIRLVGDGLVEITGRLPLRAVLGDSLGAIAAVLLERWAAQPVWLRLRGYVRLETGAARGDRRRLRLDARYFALGHRRLPASILSVLSEGSALQATRLPVPDTVDSVTVESGRVTIIIRP